jgi:branched-chain amino acid aminotransferase
MKFEITTEKVKESRISQLDPNNIGFGKVFTDHMFLADYENGEWINPRIVPYGPMSLSPATSAIHYGQAIFEGLKVFASSKNDHNIVMFRPTDNAKRLNKSAARLAMPEVPEDLFMAGLTQLLELDRQWVPRVEGGALYVRPYMFATDDFIGVKPSERYCFAIFCCPVGPYYNKALRVKVEEEYSRAAPGGVGFTKCAGNYAAAMYPTALAQKEGFDQVLWTDPIEHKFVEETGITVTVGAHLYTTDFFQISAFNKKDQIISIYYIVHSTDTAKIKTSEKNFDFSPAQIADKKGTFESFRWVDFESLNEDCMSLPIDKVAIQILKQSF